MPAIKFTSKTKEIDHGFAQALEQAGYAKGKSFVKVGVLSKDGSEDRGGITLAGIASVHEFGTADGRVPSRSWMRSTLEEQKEKIHLISAKVISDTILGKTNIRKGLNLIGAIMADMFKAKITAIQQPPLKVSPRKPRGGTNPLVDTGRLRSSQSHQVVLKKKKVRTK